MLGCFVPWFLLCLGHNACGKEHLLYYVWASLWAPAPIAAAAKSLQSHQTLCDPWTAVHQAPLPLGFSRQEHWSGLPFPSPMHESEK